MSKSPPTASLRVFLADDQSVLRQGLKTILRQEGFEVVGEASDGHTAIKMCLTLQPEIVILDVGMPLLNGIDAAREIHKSCPRTKIILLTAYTDEVSILTSIRAGVNGYVLKNGAFSTLTCTSSDTLPHRPSGSTTNVRQVGLFDDHLGACGALNAKTNCVSTTPLPWDGSSTENPAAGSTEIWEMWDYQDSHPMHLHEAQFEVINRSSTDAENFCK